MTEQRILAVVERYAHGRAAQDEKFRDSIAHFLACETRGASSKRTSLGRSKRFHKIAERYRALAASIKALSPKDLDAFEREFGTLEFPDVLGLKADMIEGAPTREGKPSSTLVLAAEQVCIAYRLITERKPATTKDGHFQQFCEHLSDALDLPPVGAETAAKIVKAGN